MPAIGAQFDADIFRHRYLEVDLEFMAIASTLVSASVGVAALVHAEIRRRRALRTTRRLLSVVAVALSAAALAWALHRQT